MKKIALVHLFFKTSLMTQLPYRINFVTQALSTLFYFGSGLIGLRIIFTHTDSLAGWTFYEIVTLLGVYQLIAGILAFFVMENVENLPDKIVDGHLDETILMPENTQFLSSFGSCNVWAITDILLGIGIMIGSIFLNLDQLTLTSFQFIVQLMQFFVLIGCSLLISYSVRMWIGTLGFWLGRTGGGFILFTSIWAMGKYPVDMYPPFFKWLLYTLVPVGVVASIPTYVLFNGMGILPFMGLLFLTFIIYLFTNSLWKMGIRKYSSAAS
ncbi:ABC-2 family transporter protein [Jeotgalibacillus sp. ET6]|uniref:ABC transporter permease n=1 Tax=Jeotgalibacillus sp. ET6 TaxID=3037260 RepID=UPI0024188E86|nr:ABC-2 family transporter protein [Jeotgalibacillus sp. ET6]MDG5471299.1 ABC-2 family transporter protein [Jeotgalibacillus sp. ET6]